MKTRIYIDGYNLYYGCLKNTPYKWLNLADLFQNKILPRSSHHRCVLQPEDPIKFYTAEISSKVALDANSVNDQRSYHAALTAGCGGLVKIIKGNYSIDQVDSRKVEYDNSIEKAPRDCSTVKVWKLEEKQSDVNIAVDAVFDAFCDVELEQIVFVTNDTDIAPALAKIKNLNRLKRRPPITIGLVVPAKEKSGYRRTNRVLKDLADWTVNYIMDTELADSQLPCRVTGGKKPALRPISWFEFPQEVENVINVLRETESCHSIPKAWNWLSKKAPNPPQNLPKLADDPSSMLHSKEGIKDVLAHVKAYVAYQKTKQ